jgi:outer membrane lipoprotein-sorting protein
VAPALGSAECDSTDACLRLIQAAQSETRSLQADFRQVKHVALLEEPLESSGTFLFEAPDHVVVTITSPEPATITIDGDEIRAPGLSDEESRALAMAPVAGTFARLGAILRGDLVGLRESFEIEARERDGSIEVVMKPRTLELRKSFEHIDLRFEGPNRSIRRIGVADAFGDRLEITLDHVRRNVEVQEE